MPAPDVWRHRDIFNFQSLGTRFASLVHNRTNRVVTSIGDHRALVLVLQLLTYFAEPLKVIRIITSGHPKSRLFQYGNNIRRVGGSLFVTEPKINHKSIYAK